MDIEAIRTVSASFDIRFLWRIRFGSLVRKRWGGKRRRRRDASGTTVWYNSRTDGQRSFFRKARAGSAAQAASDALHRDRRTAARGQIHFGQGAGGAAARAPRLRLRRQSLPAGVLQGKARLGLSRANVFPDGAPAAPARSSGRGSAGAGDLRLFNGE